MNETPDFSPFEVNCSHTENFTDTNYFNNAVLNKIVPHSLPTELSEITNSSLVCVVAYCILFFVATSGNIAVLTNLWEQYKTKHSRISLLLLHLAFADLIVCCTLIPTEVFWRLTIQWRGGNILCKLTQFLRAFGLYLSSLVLICVSLDRFLAIVFPLSILKMGSYRRIKGMLILAWFAAAVFSFPQAVFFGVEVHPEFPSFKQCVTNDFLGNPGNVKIYSIFSVAMMYFVPLFVILFAYSAIIIKLVRKSKQCSYGTEYNGAQVSLSRRSSISTGLYTDGNGGSSPVLQLRCTNNAGASLSKATSKTFTMTVVIILAFVFCWSPYATMTLWYMVDWKGAAEVDPRLQDALFLMAVGNSCVNPLIYRSFMYKPSSTRKIQCLG